jgi:hypothetical protein
MIVALRSPCSWSGQALIDSPKGCEGVPSVPSVHPASVLFWFPEDDWVDPGKLAASEHGHQSTGLFLLQAAA